MLAIDWVPSPNFGSRAEGRSIDILILHYTGMPTAERALTWLCDPASQVSSHYFVHEDGRILQLVAEEDRAWHAGESNWAGETDVNSRSIGIELANPGHRFGYRPFSVEQIDALIVLCGDILRRHPISPDRVLAHSDVAPTRKSDPGELFPWHRLYEAGIGHFVEALSIVIGPVLKRGDRGEAVAGLKQHLLRYGYGVTDGPDFDDETAAVVRAFQRHFRPVLVDGNADRSTIGTLERLIAGLPVKP